MRFGPLTVVGMVCPNCNGDDTKPCRRCGGKGLVYPRCTRCNGDNMSKHTECYDCRELQSACKRKE